MTSSTRSACPARSWSGAWRIARPSSSGRASTSTIACWSGARPPTARPCRAPGSTTSTLATVRERGIELIRIPGPGAQAVAELTFGSDARAWRARSCYADRHAARRRTGRSRELVGCNLARKTLGIVGLGSIGTRSRALAGPGACAPWARRASERGPRRRFADEGIELRPRGRARLGRLRLASTSRSATRRAA